METLNQYLQQLVTSSAFELHLEPNVNPYVVSASGNSEISNAPLLGSQISMMVFPLIPPDAKQELPNQPSINFLYPSEMGDFNFTVQKSPMGFNVTIKPALSNSSATKTSEPFTPAEDVQDEYPTIQVNGEDMPPIVLNPVDDASSTADSWEKDPAYTQMQSGLPEFDVEVEELPDGEAYADLTLDELSPAPEYKPEPETVVFDASETFTAAAAPTGTMCSRMEDLFKKMSEAGASDLHMTVGMPPMVRKDGRMKKMECAEPALTEETMKGLLHSIMPERNKEEFAERHDTDFAYEIPGLARFRSNIFMDRKGMGAVFRIIPSKMITAQQLGLPASIMELCNLTKGLVVVTGPTGSGKSTTLCAMVNHINETREDHIITIEDPIEFVHDNLKCLVNQREVHNHTSSFKDALRAALREDPDIVLVGEMRDLETISIAIETAETGHLVFGTLHTTTAPSTVDRIIDQFPADRQQQVRVMLSESLKGVVAQTLLPKKGGGRVAALEVLIVTPAISNLIREGKTFQIASAMQTGKTHGMVMLNDALYDLVQKDIVEPRDAYLKAVDKTSFEALLKRGGYSI